MKFLFVAPRFHPNLKYQVEALKDGGHEVEFFCLYGLIGEDHSATKPKILGYSKLFLILNRLVNGRMVNTTKSRFEINYGFPPVFNFVNSFRKYDPDVVVVKNIAHLYSLLAIVVARILGKKIIILIGVEKYRQRPLSSSVYYVGKIFGAQAITPLSGDYKYRNDNDNLFYVPFPHPLPSLKDNHFVNDVINVICVGKFSKRKDQLILLQAINELKDKFPIHLTLIGQNDDGKYLSMLKDFIKKQEMTDMVGIESDLPQKEVYKQYSTHDLFVLPSYNEQFSYSVLEAMSYGLPAVCSDDNGIKWYIDNGNTGMVFEHGNLVDLKSKLSKLMSDRDMIVRMGENARRFIKEECSLEKYRESIINIVHHGQSS